MNKKRLRITLLAVCLVLALLANQVIAVAADDVTVTVSDLSQLAIAINSASDGAVIGIRGQIDITNDAIFGSSSKLIYLRRIDETGVLNINNVGGNVQFQNIIFDGGEISSQSFVQIKTSAHFYACGFRNCISTVGGAVRIDGGTSTFEVCTFQNNSASGGGHIAISLQADGAILNLDNCTLRNGYADSFGGAVAVMSTNSTCNIDSCYITENEVWNYGGGVSNRGIMHISNTLLYNNTSNHGGFGTDIGNSGQLYLEDTITELVEMFRGFGILPKGWVDDYDYENPVYFEYMDATKPGSFLKLDYELLPTEVVLDSASLGIAGNEKVTGLESGKYYEITSNDITNYSKEDGTLTSTKTEALPLKGTEILGLTNGKTYLVKEFIPTPMMVLLDSLSLGIADNGKIIGLDSGKYYKILTSDTVSYSKADGTLTLEESETEELTGTEITGLTNGVTYKVEEYVPILPEPPVDPTPTPSTVILESSSLGVAGDIKIIGLTPGKQYKVTVDETTSYVKSDGTLTSMESESGTLMGTEIVGLTNGKTYMVEEYTPVPKPIEPDPTPTPTPDPKPVTPPSSNNNSGGSSHSYYSSATPEIKKGIALSSGKAVLDPTRTEYLLGYTDGLMGNKDTVTKAQLVQIVYRLLTSESQAAVFSEKNSFKDVAANAWYNEAVSSMTNAGLISVAVDGKFNPDKNITWGEMVTILAKFAKPNTEWKIITKHWARDSINTAISYRWFEYNDQFNPDGEVSRLEMLNFINTMFKWSKQ